MSDCEQRVDGALNSRADDFTVYMNNVEIEEEGSDELPPMNHYGLSFEYVEPHEDDIEKDDWSGAYFRYQLSWGGPSDEIRFKRNGKIEYVFQDWFDGATRDISDEDWAMWLREAFAVSGSAFDINRNIAQKAHDLYLERSFL